MKELSIYIDKKIDDPEHEIYLKLFLEKNNIKSTYSTNLRNSKKKIIKYDYYIFLFAKYLPLNFWKKYSDSIINHTPGYKNIYYKNLLIKFLSDNMYINLKYLPYAFVVNPKIDNTKNITNNLKIYYKLYPQKNNNDSNSEQDLEQDLEQNSTNLWIMKPYDGGLGNDIMISKEKDISNNAKTFKKLVVIQKYIENPLLLNNKKFHIRTHVLLIPIIIDNLCTGYEVYYDNNYFACTSLHDYNKTNITNRAIHITNPNLQDEETVDNDLIYLDKKVLNEIVVIDILDKKILNMCKDIFLKENLPNIINPYQEANCYELFGLDLLIDTNENVWLLEINVSPGMDIITSSVKKEIIPQLMEDMFTLIFTKIKNMKVTTTIKNLKLIGTVNYLE